MRIWSTYGDQRTPKRTPILFIRHSPKLAVHVGRGEPQKLVRSECRSDVDENLIFAVSLTEECWDSELEYELRLVCHGHQQGLYYVLPGFGWLR